MLRIRRLKLWKTGKVTCPMSLAPGGARIWPEEGSSWGLLTEHPECARHALRIHDASWKREVPRIRCCDMYTRGTDPMLSGVVVWAWVLHDDIKALWRQKALLSQERIYLPSSLLNFIPKFCWLTHWGSFARSTIRFFFWFHQRTIGLWCCIEGLPWWSSVHKTPGFHCRGWEFDP